MIVRALAISLLASVALTFVQCRSVKDDQMVPIGPNVKADLLVYFTTSTTEEKINEFWREVLSQPHPEGRGHDLKEGISGVLRIFPAVEGHEGIAVSFFPDATTEERQLIKRAAGASPLVFRILENRTPADVKTLQ